MALLKCKMCGGTLDYDRQRNLAICPYCGSKSTVFEQDRKLFEQFQTAFEAILNQTDDRKRRQSEEGFWVEASDEMLTREDGECIQISYLTKRRADMCTVYVARRNILFVFDEGFHDSAERYREMVGQIRYPNESMEKELSRYIPKVVTECRLADGREFLAIEKEEGVYPLGMLGLLLDRHVAWIVSRLENLCCLLEYNDMVLNGFSLENLFVNTADHQICLYGGWWFAGFRGTDAVGASKSVFPYLAKDINGHNKNQTGTDLESIRLVAAKLLGCESRAKLREVRLLPKAFEDFLVCGPEHSARADFKKWDKVLLESYGERKFIPLSVTEEEIYGL